MNKSSDALRSLESVVNDLYERQRRRIRLTVVIFVMLNVLVAGCFYFILSSAEPIARQARAWLIDRLPHQRHNVQQELQGNTDRWTAAAIDGVFDMLPEAEDQVIARLEHIASSWQESFERRVEPKLLANLRSRRTELNEEGGTLTRDRIAAAVRTTVTALAEQELDLALRPGLISGDNALVDVAGTAAARTEADEARRRLLLYCLALSRQNELADGVFLDMHRQVERRFRRPDSGS